jgi:uncharacterized protein YdaU (DUF1376 family)
MPFFGRDFYSDENVICMSLEQQGAYVRLLWLAWQQGSIPADPSKLAALCAVTVDKFTADLWPSMSTLFASSPDGDRLIHWKIEQIRNGAEAFRRKCSQAGKRGNEKRWGGRDTEPDADPT